MAFPKNLLTPNEEIVLERNPHWIYMAPSAVMLGLAFLVFVFLLIVHMGYAWVGAVAMLIVLIGTFGQFLRWRTTQFVVTSERIVTRQGILSKGGMEIPLDRVTNISYHQTLLERIVKAGDLVIESAGESGQEPFANVANPSDVQTCIYEQSEAFQARRSQIAQHYEDDAPGGNTENVTDQLEKLASLRDRGILSGEEFDQQKKNLLDTK